MKKVYKNPAGFVAFFILLISAFLLPLFQENILDETLPNKGTTLISVAPEIIQNVGVYLKSAFGIYKIGILLTFIFTIGFYFLNGIGLVYNRFSRYASYLSFLYLILGLLIYNDLNKDYGINLLGMSVTSLSIGLGLWIVPLVGVLYLLFYKEVNKRIHI
ncbi:hypothetical protein GYA25_02395 [Candidatus Woesearchaeota archaeon]|nr:hypothetical protein [Candidatus Woesearchaeota archaeon]